MLKKLRSHVQSLVHLPARSMKRAVSAKPANDNPCHDDYDILRTLSTGESAIVYLVREKNTPRLYVLKVIKKLCRDVSTVLNEQAALTRLSGSNFILPLHACFHDTNNWYFLTEYLPGGDLQGLQLLVSLDVEAVRFYMAELLLAIEHVHAHSIIHRDIRQENVFIDTDGHIFLGDFSDAWLFSDSAAETHLTRGRVDLWAFGVFLYKMLTGKEANPTWRRHLSEHIKCDEFFVIVESQLMTEDAADLVSQLLRKDRDSRLSDITEIKKHPFFGAMQVSDSS
ncbi:kinase-like domain-containing protein [Russula aff. rugulosa BPL654]|nr:kinase-like domain-containing protein [Russula aff. rugulosa BPL654]